MKSHKHAMSTTQNETCGKQSGVWTSKESGAGTEDMGYKQREIYRILTSHWGLGVYTFKLLIAQ
jgi:hypothetical protein